MSHKMIVLDLDDTLLRDDLTISDRTRDALIAARERGIMVVLASGRPLGAIWRYACELGLVDHGGWIISYNGAVITESRTREVLFQKPLHAETIHEIHDLAVAHGANILTYVDDRIVTPRADEWVEVERTLTGMDVLETGDFKGAVRVDCIKAIVVDEPVRLAAMAETIRPLVSDRLNIVISKPFFLEFTDLGIDKKHSLSLLIEKIGIEASQVVAVGDSYNDMGMLELAGVGVCMANGREAVKAIADFIAPSNMDDGVVAVLERYFTA